MKQIINYSIIIPHKNIPKLLKRCLASIPKRDDIQIIVVDDNSDPSIVDFNNFPGVGEECVEVVFTKENKGAGYARNIGLSKAIGKWLLFADADDFYNENFLEITDSYLSSDNDIIFFCVNCVDSDDITKPANRGRAQQLKEHYNLYKEDAKREEYFYRYEFSEPWAKMIKKSLVDKNHILFDETMVANDYMFSVKSGYVAKKIDVSPKQIYTLTQRENSLSSNYAGTFDKLKIRILIATDVTLFFNKNGISYKISPLRGLMVVLLKKYPTRFISILYSLKKEGIDIKKLFIEIFLLRQ